MEKKELESLMQKHLSRTISSAERIRLDKWYIHHAKNAPPLTDETILVNRMIEMDDALLFKNGVANQSVRTKLWIRIGAAAAVLLVIGLGLFPVRSYISNLFQNTSTSIDAKTDIAPGIEGATLTLGNGEKILINAVKSGNIASQSGVTITKTPDGQIIYEIKDNKTAGTTYNSLTTARGEQTKLRLPDGSIVFLNAASSLKYPTSFANSKNRTVALTGEGYFEIAKDKRHPFIVKAREQVVKVLGTHFNINAYPDETGIKTTLLEGSVKVYSAFSSEPAAKHASLFPNDEDGLNHKGNIEGGIILKPGQQSLMTGHTELKVSTVDVNHVTDWTVGDFIFREERLASIMRRVARWYNIDVVFNDDVDKDQTFTGTVSRSKNISEVLKGMQATGKIKFTIVGKQVIVAK